MGCSCILLLGARFLDQFQSHTYDGTVFFLNNCIKYKERKIKSNQKIYISLFRPQDGLIYLKLKYPYRTNINSRPLEGSGFKTL